jgi:hypothetical protein
MPFIDIVIRRMTPFESPDLTVTESLLHFFRCEHAVDSRRSGLSLIDPLPVSSGSGFLFLGDESLAFLTTVVAFLGSFRWMV